MSSVSFKINTKREEEQVLEFTKKNIEFIKKKRIRTTWPKDTVVEKEYDEEKYKKFLEKVKEDWKRDNNDFLEKLAHFFKLNEDFHFTVKISKYGPLGFYNSLKKTVTINMINENIVETIKHEMLHILVDHFMEKYSVNHKEKEDLVNFLTEFIEKQDAK